MEGDDTMWLRRATAVVAALFIAVLVWLLFIDDDDGDEGAGKTVKVYSASALPAAAAKVGYPVYWLGREPGVQYELTVITDGRTYVRYLPKGVPEGAVAPLRTVGSYGQENPIKVLRQLDERPGNRTFDAPGGGLALTPRDVPTSVYVGFPNDNVQIEVYDARPGRAEELVKQGKIVPVR